MLEIMILTNHMQERLGITPEMMSASMGSGQAAPAAAPAAGGDGGDGAAGTRSLAHVSMLLTGQQSRQKKRRAPSQ